jgi:hypothetical protein
MIVGLLKRNEASAVASLYPSSLMSAPSSPQLRLPRTAGISFDSTGPDWLIAERNYNLEFGIWNPSGMTPAGRVLVRRLLPRRCRMMWDDMSDLSSAASGLP